MGLVRDVERPQPPVVARVGACAAREQQLDDLRLALAGGPHQERQAVRIDAVR